MKKILAMLLALLCVAMLFAGCSKTPADDGSAGSKAPDANVNVDEAGDIKLNLWIGYPEFDEWLAQMAKAYNEKHPNVTIECTSYNLRDVETKLSTALPANSGPDIVSIDPTFFLRFVEAGYAQPAPANVVEFINSGVFDEPVRNYCYVGDTAYSVTSLISAGAIYYNKDM